MTERGPAAKVWRWKKAVAQLLSPDRRDKRRYTRWLARFHPLRATGCVSSSRAVKPQISAAGSRLLRFFVRFLFFSRMQMSACRFGSGLTFLSTYLRLVASLP